MARKLKSRRGVSVAEMLIAVLLLSLLTAGGITVAAGVMAVHNHMVSASNAEILASTVAETITNEIRLGKDISVTPIPAGTDTNSLMLNSVRLGADAVLRLDDGRLVADTQVYESGAATPKTVQLLAETVYGELKLSELTFAPINKDDDVPPPNGVTGTPGTAGRTAYTVTFTVESEQDGKLWHGSVSAAPMQPAQP